MKSSKAEVPSNTEALRLAKTICYTCKLVYPRWPSHFVPSYILLQILVKYQKRLAKSWFTLRPMPNKLYDQFTDDGGDSLYKSEHIILMHPKIYKRFSKCDHVSVRLLQQSNQSENISFGDKKKQITIMQIKSYDFCPLHCVYVKENCYENLGQKFKMTMTLPSSVEITSSRWSPQIATKVCIFFINPSIAVASDVIDSVLKAYFSVPRLLSRNFTYAVELTLEMLGHHLYAQHFDAFVALRRIHFRCIHLETDDGGFEPSAIFLLKHTELQQTSTINYKLPAIRMDLMNFVPQCPFGMTRHFDKISSSVAPFLSGDCDALTSRHIWPIFLVQGDRGIGKLTLLRCVADALGAHFYSIAAADVCAGVPNQMEIRLKQTLTEVNRCEPVILCLREFNRFAITSTTGGGEISNELDGRLLMAFEAELQHMFMTRRQVVIVALTEDKEIASPVQRLFLDTIKIDAPSQIERLQILRWLACTKSNSKSPYHWNQQMENTLKQTAERANGFLFDDLKMLYNSSVDSTSDTFEQKLSEMQSSYASSLGAPQVPNVRWSDIGGLAALKDEIQMSVDISLRSGTFAVRRSGILLYGPPGTGKTLVAKAVATECGMCFLAVQGPELLNMYVGQSEKNVREVFARARSASPCVIFLDELDSLAPNRGVAGDSGGVMDRVVSQLLAEMDGIQLADSSNNKKDERIFILAATNRPDLIDPALLRPGRFDKLLYVGPCITPAEKEAVFTAQLQKFTFDKQYKTIETLTKKVCSILPKDQHLTGADCYAICSNAWMNALRRIVRKNAKDVVEVEVTLDDFKGAITGFHSSVNERDLQYFQQLQQNYS